MNLSLAITTFNRYEFTIESFCQVIDDPRIDDIIILDDCSTDGSFEKLVRHFAGIEKVRVMRQLKNRGMSLNKRDAISFARNEWVIIFDSDNVITPSFIDAFEKSRVLTESFGEVLEIDDPYYKIIYCPDFASPRFNYLKYSGKIVNRENVKRVIKDEMGNCLLNTCNCIINRDEYLRVYKPNHEMIATDTIWMNYLWLNAGNWFYVVPDMQYFHRVHPGSGFLEDAAYNMKQAEKIKKMIMAL